MTTTISTSRRSSSSDSGVERIALCPRAGHAGCVITPAGMVHIRCSTRVDGSFDRERVPLGDLESRRRRFVDRPWTMLDEHHGVASVRVHRPGAGDGHSGDIAVTDVDDAVLGVWTADCAPLVLVGVAGEFAVVHAGWRGLAAGVIDAAVVALSQPVVHAVLGPCIEPCCYEFGLDDAASVAAGVHAHPDSITRHAAVLRPGAAHGSTPRRSAVSLDVPAAVAAAFAHHGVGLTRIGSCTGCSFPGYSHRVRRDTGRHVLAAWREAA